MDEGKELYMISHLINPNKKRKNKHYVPIQLVNANRRLGKSKYCKLSIPLDSGVISSIVLGKHKQKLCHKNTQPVKWSTKGGDFLTTYKTNVELVLTELDATKRMKWIFHVDDLQKHSRYDMIIGRDLLLELKLYLCFSDYATKGNGGIHEEFTAPMRDPYELCDHTSFINEELWKVNMYSIPRDARVGSWT